MGKPKKMSPQEIKEANKAEKALAGSDLKNNAGKERKELDPSYVETCKETEEETEEELEKLKLSGILEDLLIYPDYTRLISKGQLKENFKTLIRKVKETESVLLK